MADRAVIVIDYATLAEEVVKHLAGLVAQGKEGGGMVGTQELQQIRGELETLADSVAALTGRVSALETRPPLMISYVDNDEEEPAKVKAQRIPERVRALAEECALDLTDARIVNLLVKRWLTAAEAGRLTGVTRGRIGQLKDRGRMRFETRAGWKHPRTTPAWALEWARTRQRPDGENGEERTA